MEVDCVDLLFCVLVRVFVNIYGEWFMIDNGFVVNSMLEVIVQIMVYEIVYNCGYCYSVNDMGDLLYLNIVLEQVEVCMVLNFQLNVWGGFGII